MVLSKGEGTSSFNAESRHQVRFVALTSLCTEFLQLLIETRQLNREFYVFPLSSLFFAEFAFLFVVFTRSKTSGF